MILVRIILHFYFLLLDIPDDDFVVSFAGKLSKTKGIDTILQAKKLLDNYENLHLNVLSKKRKNFLGLILPSEE